jgi:outer membrane protein, multidrug efflux system
MMTRYPVLLVAFVLAACTVAKPDYRKPEVDLPAAWKDVPGATAQPVDRQWWRVFGDPMLEKLIEEAFANNLDVRAAFARVDEARALAELAEAERSPTVGANVSRDRTRISTVTGMPIPPGVARERNNTRATVNVSYELDLWGRLRATTDAARAEVLASEAARDTVSIALAAQVAQSYFSLRSLDAQIASTRRALDLRQEGLGLQRKRLDAGVISEYDLRQLEAEAAAARAQLPAQERAREREESALAVLTGRSPKALIEASIGRRDTSIDSESLAAAIPVSLPSELLLRRPDIAEAEQRLMAANARIAAARTAYFPSIGLTGFFGAESAALSNLFTGPAGIWQFAAQLAQPLFSGGRLEAQVDAARAREQQLVVQYQRAVQNAFRDVKDALSAQARSRDSFDAETARVQALSETLRFARLRYEHGLVSQLEVLDAERNLLAAELNRIDAWRAQRAALADLYRALGGGWSASR